MSTSTRTQPTEMNQASCNPNRSAKTEFFWFETYADDPDGKRVADHRMLLRFMKASSPLWEE